MFLYNLLLFILTLIGGSAPLWLKSIDEQRTNYLLAFSGSFLLSITLLHLLPETFRDLGHEAGLFVLIGFFVQLLIQRFTHGVEHGHTHVAVEDHHHHHHLTTTIVITVTAPPHAHAEHQVADNEHGNVERGVRRRRVQRAVEQHPRLQAEVERDEHVVAPLRERVCVFFLCLDGVRV